MAGSFLSNEERHQLRALAVGGGSNPLHARRAQVLLLRDLGMSLRAIKAQTKMSPRRIRYWQKRYRDEGLKGLNDRLRPGRKKKLTEEIKAQVWEETRRSAAKATSRLIAAQLGLSRTSVTRVWQERGLKVSAPMTRREFLRRAARAATVLVSSPGTFVEPSNQTDVQSSDLLRATQNALRLHHVNNDHERALAELRQVVSLARQRGNWQVEKRNRLNLAYIEMGRGAPEAVQHFLDISNDALEKGDHVTAAEAAIARGRIFHAYEEFEPAAEEFAIAERHIPKGTALPDRIPKYASAVGHSLVISSDYGVSPEVLLTFIRHFQAKNDVIRGIRRQSEFFLKRGVDGLELVSRIDKKSDAATNLAFDLLWQVEGRLELGDSAVQSCLDQSSEIFTGKIGAGAGYLHLNRGIKAAYDGESWEDEFQAALDYFFRIALRAGVASVHRHYYELLSQNHSDETALKSAWDSALVSAVLLPTHFSMNDLQVAASSLRCRGLEKYLIGRVDDLQSFNGKVFAPLEGLVKRFGDGPMLTQFVDNLQNLRSRILRHRV